MKAYIGKDGVYVCENDEDDVTCGTTREFCIAAAMSMLNDGNTQHVEIITNLDSNSQIELPAGKVARVLIELIDDEPTPEMTADIGRFIYAPAEAIGNMVYTEAVSA